MSLVPRVGAGLVVLAAATAPQQTKTEVTVGAGGGSYTTGFGCGGVMRAPYREASVQFRAERGGLSGGVALAVRDDDQDAARVIANPNDNEPPAIRPGVRSVGSPWVGYRWRFLHGRLGAHVGDYFQTHDQKDQPLVLPRVGLGVGGERWFVEAGLLDPPELLPPFSGNGGVGLLTLRGGLRFADGQQATFTLGASEAEDDAFLAGSWLGRVSRGLLVGAGAFVGPNSAGGLLLVGASIEP